MVATNTMLFALITAEVCTCTGRRIPTTQQPEDTMPADITLRLSSEQVVQVLSK